jgi:hypothetical protein
MSLTGDPIASITLVSAASSVTFSGIPQTYTDLLAVCRVRSTGAASTSGGTLRLNGDAGSNYSHTILFDVGSIRAANVDRMRVFGDIPTGAFATTFVHFASYANTNVNKAVLSAYGEAGSGISRIAGLWRSTSAITSISFFSNDGGSDSMESESTFDLYGVRGA